MVVDRHHRQRRGGGRRRCDRGPGAQRPAPPGAGAHAPPGRPRVFGSAPRARVSPEWAAWANGVAVRELDFHDTFLAADYSHPGDNIPPLVAVAQHWRRCRRRPDPRHRHRLRDPGRPGPRRSACTSTRSTTSRTSGPSAAAGHRRAARPAARDDLPGDRPGPAPRPPRPASRARARSPAGRPTRRRSPARSPIEAVDRAMRGEGAPVADLRGRGRRHRLDARTARTPSTGAAARAGRAQARDPRHLHQGALGRVPGPGADRPGPPDAATGSATSTRSRRSCSTPATTPTRDRHRLRRPAEVSTRAPAARRWTTRSCTSSPSRSQDGAGTTSAPTRPRARPARHGRAVAQDPHRRGPGVDAPLPRPDPAEKAFGGRIVVDAGRRRR